MWRSATRLYATRRKAPAARDACAPVRCRPRFFVERGRGLFLCVYHLHEVPTIARPSSLRLASLLSIVVAAAASAARQDAPGPPAAPRPATVHLDAIVTDARGNPIPGLTASDFELIDSGATQAIDTVEFRGPAPPVARGRASGPAPDAPAPAGRVLAIFLDEYHVSAGPNTTRARDAILRFIDEQVGPDDLVAVMKPLDSVVSIRLTRDRGEMRAAIERFEGCKDDYTPRTPFEASVISRAPDAARPARVQVVLSALQALTTQLGARRDGRKAIVLVSEGFPTGLPRPRTRLPDVQTLIRSALRFDVAIYTFDPRAPGAAPESGGAPDGAATVLQAVARQTSGEATADADAFGPALRRVTRDLDAYYRLTFKPSSGSDGAFHAIEIRVRRKNAQVRARAGYWAPSIDDLRRAARFTSTPAPPAFKPKPTRISPLIQPWFRMTRGDEGRTRVLFMWEPRTGASSTPAARRVQIGTLTLTATTADGTQIFQGRLSPVRNGIDSSSPTRAVIEVKPGVLALEMSIEGMNDAVVDSDARTMTIPDLNGARTVLGTAEVVRTRTAVDFRAAAADTNTPPTAVRVYNRSERLIIRAPAYGPAGAAATVTARLLNPIGQMMRQLTPIDPPSADGIAQFELSLASLPPGEYRIEVAAVSGASEARESFAFRVIG